MKADIELTRELKEILKAKGADLTGIGDISEVPAEIRGGFPIGVSVAVKYPKEIIRGIAKYPTADYQKWYGKLNELLDDLVTSGADWLQEKGYQAIAKSRSQVGKYKDDCKTILPHKTIATRAGMGWIGKSALLVTEEYGSMIRISSILTDAPLAAAEPINESKCGDCAACRDACPAGAIYGRLWEPSLWRDELFDFQKCRTTMQRRAVEGIGEKDDICGKCIEVCPFTRRYLNQEEENADQYQWKDRHC